MTLIRLGLISTLALALIASSAAGGTIVVDPAGGGDYDNIPEAAFHAAADDTVLVLPGTYTLGPAFYSWPIPLTADSPTFLSQAGAAVTIIEGDGTLPAFDIAEGTTDATMLVHGFTFRSLEQTLGRHHEVSTLGQMRFTDNVVESIANSWPALEAWGSSDGLIARNVFTGPGTGPGEGIHLRDSFVGFVEDNDVSGYFSGIVGGGGGLDIRRNNVHDSSSCGIVAYGALVAYDNVVEDNSYAGFMLDAETSLEGNVIRGNGVGITWPGVLSGSFGGQVRMNDIYENGTNIAAPELMYELDFDATMNWWGTSDPDEIAEGIWDCHDPLAGFCCIVFLPWCTEPIPGCGTTPAKPSSWGTIKALYR